MSFRILPVVMCVCVVLFSSGCSSYNLSGRHVAFTPVEPIAKFKLRYYRKQLGKESMWSQFSIGKNGGSRVSRHELEKVLIEKYPEIFTCSDNGIPISIDVSEHSAQSSIRVVAYIMSLGVLPGKYGFDDSYIVKLTVIGNEDYKLSEERVDYIANSWVSAFSPFGCFMEESGKAYKDSYYSGKGIGYAWAQADFKVNQKRIFMSEVASASAKIISDNNSEDFKRVQIINQTIRGGE